MINEKTLICAPIKFKDICYIYPPKVKDIILEDSFNIYRKILTISQEEIEDEYVEKKMDMTYVLNPLEYIINNAYNVEGFDLLAKKAFSFFIKKEVHFLYEQKMILVGNLKEDLKAIQDISELKIIREEDYFDFQNMIRESLGEAVISPPDPNEHPRIKRMKAKARYRDKIKAKQGIGLNLSTSLISICCMGMGLNPLNIGELSYAAIKPLMRQYQEKEKYQTDIDSLLAGADSKKIKPKYWIRNIND